MIEGYMSIKEAAELWDLTPRRVQVFCSEGRIEGASRLGREWAIPATAQKPADKRIKSGRFKDWRKTSENQSNRRNTKNAQD